MPAPYAAENHGDEKDIYIHSNQVSLTKFGSSNRNTSTKTFSKVKLLNNHKKKPNQFDNNQKLRQKVEIEFEKLLD